MYSTKEFRVLVLVNGERNAYGIRYNDFTRYRKHCANKVHRLRSSLKLTHGKGKSFRKLPEINIDTAKGQTLELLLFEAERLYAFAQELYRIEQHHKAIAKHRRCLLWATKLLTLCQQFPEEQFPASCLCEVLIYTHVLLAKLSFKRDQFDLTIKHHTVAYHLLLLLQGSQRSSRDQALANVFIDEISPEIRFSSHELGYNRSFDVPKLVAASGPKNSAVLIPNYLELCHRINEEKPRDVTEGSSQKLKPWLWEGEPIPIRNPELVDVLLQVQQAEGKMPLPVTSEKLGSKNRIKAYDAVLQAWTDAEDVARKLMESNQLLGQSSDGIKRDADFVHSYIMYYLLSRRSERDTLLVRALMHNSSRNQQNVEVKVRANTAIIKLFSTTLQSLIQIRALSIVEECLDIASRIDSGISYLKARRCLYMARCYTLLKCNSYEEALALTQRAFLHVREAHVSLQAIVPDEAGSLSMVVLPSRADFLQLEKELNEDERDYKAKWFIMNHGKLGSHQGQESHQKRLFFDIALNYIDIDLEALHARAQGEKTKPAKTIPIKQKEAPNLAPGETSAAAESTPTSRLGFLGSWWGRN